MRKPSLQKISQRIAYILRHNPDSINAKMDSQGWIETKVLLKGLNIDMKTLEHIVNTDNKQRYSFNKNKTKIRANQGHSINVNLELKPEENVPEKLYHGTKQQFIDFIKRDGLKSMSRQYVHLSADLETAKIVANRRQGQSVILVIHTKQMIELNFKFYKSENGVWLINHVPYNFISIHAGV